MLMAMEPLMESLKSGLTITFFVFVMMMLIDHLNVLTKGRLSVVVKGGRSRQYFMASFLGAIPGCLGSFLNVSFYVRGLISFGAIAGGMIATTGDEAFVMFALFPGKAFLLVGILFVIGVISSYLIDALVPYIRIKPCEECHEAASHSAKECRCSNLREIFSQIRRPSFIRFLLGNFLLIGLYLSIAGARGDWSWEDITLIVLLALGLGIVATVPDHYLRDHIWEHIAKKHLWRIFLWSFGALLVVNLGLEFFSLEAFVRSHMVWVLLISILIGVIPESGPHLIFVMMFAKGLIPFSVLVASSIVQDGHGLIPLLSYTVKDSVMVKIFNVIVGLIVGGILYWIGL